MTRGKYEVCTINLSKYLIVTKLYTHHSLVFFAAKLRSLIVVRNLVKSLNVILLDQSRGTVIVQRSRSTLQKVNSCFEWCYRCESLRAVLIIPWGWRGQLRRGDSHHPWTTYTCTSLSRNNT